MQKIRGIDMIRIIKAFIGVIVALLRIAALAPKILWDKYIRRIEK